MGLKFLFIAFAIAFVIALLIHANKPKDKDEQNHAPKESNPTRNGRKKCGRKKQKQLWIWLTIPIYL